MHDLRTLRAADVRQGGAQAARRSGGRNKLFLSSLDSVRVFDVILRALVFCSIPAASFVIGTRNGEAGQSCDQGIAKAEASSKDESDNETRGRDRAGSSVAM